MTWLAPCSSGRRADEPHPVATLVTQQLLFDGLISGLVFGLLAMGIVLVYRATRVINFAVGNMGIIGAGLIALLVVQYDVPFWLAVRRRPRWSAPSTARSIELVVIRRLFNAPRVIVLVATIGVAQLSLAILPAYPEIDDSGRARSRWPIGAPHDIGSIRITGAQLSILIIVPLIALALGWFLSRDHARQERQGLRREPRPGPTVTASARSGSPRSCGPSPARSPRCRSASWPARRVRPPNLATLGPSTLVRALAAAVIAGMVSFPRAFLAGIAIGLVQALISFNFLDQPGLMDFLVLLAVLVAVYFQSRQSAGETQAFSFVPKRRPIPERLRDVWWVRHLDRVGLVLLGLGAVSSR